MDNVIQLRRPVKRGDQIKLGELLVYTVTRVEGRRLYGYRKNAPTFLGNPIERWITADYRNGLTRVINGKEITLRLTHMDGRHIL